MSIATRLIDKGKKEGLLKGKLEGKALALKKVAIKPLARNIDAHLVQETTELPLDVIGQLRVETTNA